MKYVGYIWQRSTTFNLITSKYIFSLSVMQYTKESQ
jgi:hypothetical protein